MKNPKFEQLGNILNEKLGIHRNNCTTVIDFTLALHKSRTVNLSQMSNYSMRTGDISSASIYKNYQRLVHKSRITQSDLAKCVLRLLSLEDCRLTLALDRTNWKYGKEDINLLVLSVCVLGCALPLYWTELDSRGNSNTQERIALLNQFIAEFGVANIDYLVADREFIGNDWFTYLTQTGINFIVRIKSNMLLEANGDIRGAGKIFSRVSQVNMLSVQVKIDGLDLSAQATISKENELVIVVSNNLVEPNLLVVYSKRWRIECLFGNLKTKGFNFEDTHFTAKERIGNLTKLIVLAFAICYLLGLIRASQCPIIIKKHGYKQHSYFRYGYDLLIQKLNQNLTDAIQLVTLCMSEFTLEERCKKIICVM
jgi:Transposase DDE domain